jgi:hypothetical protein
VLERLFAVFGSASVPTTVAVLQSTRLVRPDDDP